MNHSRNGTCEEITDRLFFPSVRIPCYYIQCALCICSTHFDDPCTSSTDFYISEAISNFNFKVLISAALKTICCVSPVVVGSAAERAFPGYYRSLSPFRESINISGSPDRKFMRYEIR